MIWFALLIPLIAILFVSIKYTKRITVLEYVILFVVPLACISIGKWASVHSQTKDTEYWNSFGTSCVYEQRWDEEVPCRHPRYVTKTREVTDSDGNTRTETYEEQDGYEHAYDVDDHPEQWTLYDNILDSFNVSQSYFENLCKLWNVKKFKDMNRDFHSIDGDAYVTEYDNNFDHTIPLCVQHIYENKVQCSKSVFNFDKVSSETKSQYTLFDYPPENVFDFKPVLGCDNQKASSRLSNYNALNGDKKRLHMLLLVFNNQPLEAGLFQEAYWKGGNKNEFVVCVGLKGKDISWTKVISWTDVEELKVKVAREIKEMKEFDAVKIIDYMGTTIPKTFIKKNFRDFNYLSVEPTMRALIITYVITLVVTLIIVVIEVNNDYNLNNGYF